VSAGACLEARQAYRKAVDCADWYACHALASLTREAVRKPFEELACSSE
ncbi:MAG: hypothetical protein GY930_02745, partial [bacterium]|nr:hypothetical protein [bacterium]